MSGRQITKEYAKKIVKKLKAKEVTSRSKARDEYEVKEGEIVLGFISIRRASEKDKGHDYIPGNLHISPHQAKDLANCPWTRDDYIACMKAKGVLPRDEEEGEEELEQSED